MVSRSGDCSPDFQALGYSSSRSLCHQIIPSAAPVCFSSTGSQGLCSGCYVPRFKKPICICISSIQTCPNKIRDSNSRFILIAPVWPQRSWFSVILSLIIDFPRELPVHRGLVSQFHGEVLHHNPSVTSSRLDVVRSQIKGRHISEFATQCISQSRREFTLKVYSTRWRIISDWCQQRQVNLSSLFNKIDRFFYLFDTLELSVASIKGYRSAISNTLKFSKAADCTADPIISDLIEGFCLRRPVSRSLTPKWNLTCVLWSLIKTPYEPLKTADIKYITLKAVFLLTFAAARRRSEIHALSVEEGCFFVMTVTQIPSPSSLNLGI